MKIESRFLKYISFDTQSDDSSTTSPSTDKQLALADFLAEEMKILGIKQVYRDPHGVVYGIIPGNTGGMGDRIGFIAHMDTSPDAPGANVNPQMVRDYDGGIITLNAERNIVLDPEDSPELRRLLHHDIITTDGTTLLGADDKAGIAIIMTMAEYLHRHPEFKHNDISIAFTPDEEIGRGTDHFDPERFLPDALRHVRHLLLPAVQPGEHGDRAEEGRKAEARHHGGQQGLELCGPQAAVEILPGRREIRC